MKIRSYDLLFRKWNESEQEYAFTGDSDSADTYGKAVALAKKYSKEYDAVSIELYEVDTREYEGCTEEDIRAYYLYDISNFKWTERYVGGRQYPAVWINDREIWRWDMGSRDLKPKTK